MGIQVTVTFEFPDIDEPDDAQAAQAIGHIKAKAQEWVGQRWHDNQVTCAIWVDDEAQPAPHLHVSDEERSYGPRR